MKLLKYVDFVLESKGILECPVIFSDSFVEKCEKIESPVSKAILDMNRKKSSYTFINDNLDGFTIQYTEAYRVLDYLEEIYSNNRGFDAQKYMELMSTPSPDTDFWNNKNRVDIRIGRFVRRFLGNEFSDSEIEDFVNNWKSLKNDNSKFEFRSGDDLVDAYNSSNYDLDGGYNPLFNSCMNDRDDLVDFYLHVPDLEIVILLNSDNQIIGRALLWTDVDGRKLLDRVYYMRDSDYFKFIDLAKENGWFYKKRNISGGSSWILNNTEHKIKTKIKYPKEVISHLFPYVDSFYYLDDKNGYLMNYEPTGSYYFLNDTDGGYEYYSDLYDIRGNRITEVDDYVKSKTQGGLIYYYNAEHVVYDGFDDYIELSYLESPKNGFIYDELEHQWYKKDDYEKIKSGK